MCLRQSGSFGVLERSTFVRCGMNGEMCEKKQQKRLFEGEVYAYWKVAEMERYCCWARKKIVAIEFEFLLKLEGAHKRRIPGGRRFGFGSFEASAWFGFCCLAYFVFCICICICICLIFSADFFSFFLAAVAQVRRYISTYVKVSMEKEWKYDDLELSVGKVCVLIVALNSTETHSARTSDTKRNIVVVVDKEKFVPGIP